MTSKASSTERDYLRINDQIDAVDALETTADNLEAIAAGNTIKWKWAIIALHNAVQGFMVLALKSTWKVRVLHRDDRNTKVRAEHDHRQAVQDGDDAAAAAALEVAITSGGGLAAFNQLYARIKEPDRMRHFTNSRHFTPRTATDGPFDGDGRMERLNKIRGSLVHPVEDAHSIEVTLLVQLAETGLHVIDVLFNQSNNITWFPELDGDLEERGHAALARATDALSRISAKQVT
jgi:hypothetical protein